MSPDLERAADTGERSSYKTRVMEMIRKQREVYSHALTISRALAGLPLIN